MRFYPAAKDAMEVRTIATNQASNQTNHQANDHAINNNQRDEALVAMAKT